AHLHPHPGGAACRPPRRRPGDGGRGIRRHLQRLRRGTRVARAGERRLRPRAGPPVAAGRGVRAGAARHGHGLALLLRPGEAVLLPGPLGPQHLRRGGHRAGAGGVVRRRERAAVFPRRGRHLPPARGLHRVRGPHGDLRPRQGDHLVPGQPALRQLHARPFPYGPRHQRRVRRPLPRAWNRRLRGNLVPRGLAGWRLRGRRPVHHRLLPV
ncbi:MAG: hypothetical protein AVDCRST_MAG68-3774, partial [uncultured Gemmatimonadetes bacterium]